MYPFIRSCYNSIWKHYLRCLFLKYLASCNKMLFLASSIILQEDTFLAIVFCNNIIFRASCPSLKETSLRNFSV